MELGSLPDGGLVQATDLFVISRGGAARRVSGSRFVLTDATGAAVLPGDPQMATGAALRSNGAKMLQGDGGANTTLFSGSSAFSIRNAADTATLLSLSNAGALAINGTFNAVGAISQNGNPVWHAGNFSPSSYAALSGATFTGLVDVVGANVRADVFVARANVATPNLDAFVFRPADNTIALGAGGEERLRAAVSGVTVTGALSVTQLIGASSLATTGAITQAGNQVWHAGNFAPSDYAALSGAAFTGNISAPSIISASATAVFGYWNAAQTTRYGYTQHNGTAFALVNGQAGPMDFYTADTLRGSFGAAGGFNVLGALSQAGNQVWHAGNFSPSNYATTSALASGLAGKQDAIGYTPANRGGDTFTGAVSGTSFAASGAMTAASMAVGGNAVWHAGNFSPSNYAALAGATFTGAIRRDANFGLDIVSGNAQLTFDANDYLYYDRTANKLILAIGGTAVLSIDSAGTVRALGDFIGATAP